MAIPAEGTPMGTQSSDDGNPVVAIIPARGGSKGVPQKNLQEVGGIPLVVRAVRAARDSSVVDRVIVSSDDEEILALVAEAGAEIHHRSVATASDTASSESALIEVIRDLALDGIGGSLAFLQCTSPFIAGYDVEAVLAPVLAGVADATFSAVPFHGYLWVPLPHGDARPVGHAGQRRARRQDESPRLLETGAVYAMRIEGLLEHGTRFHGRTVAVAVDPRRAIEIDSPEDLAVARAIAPLLDAAPDVEFNDGALPSLGEIDLVVLDFDGVFTDDRVLVTADGTEAVFCDRSDGRAVRKLREHVDVLVLSSEIDPVVRARCAKLGLESSQGHGDGKGAVLLQELVRRGVEPERVLYVGNDTNDLECLRLVGHPVVVADAPAHVRSAARTVLAQSGGRGALRELAERLLQKKL